MEAIHPVMADILAAHGIMPTDYPRRAAYIIALKRMDWHYDHSDDQSVWQRARNELKRLRAERAVVDPDGALWLRYAPATFHAEIHHQGQA